MAGVGVGCRFTGFVRLLLLVPSARLATSVERKGEAKQGAGGRIGRATSKRILNYYHHGEKLNAINF